MTLFSIPLFAFQADAADGGTISLEAFAGVDATSSRQTGATFGSSVSVGLPAGFRFRAAMDLNIAYDIRFFLADVEYVPFSPFAFKLGTSRLLYLSLNSGGDSIEGALLFKARNGFRLAAGFSYNSLSIDGVSAIFPFGSTLDLSESASFLPLLFLSLPVFRSAASSCDFSAYSKNVLFAPTESMVNARLSFQTKLSRAFRLNASASYGFRGLSGLSFGFESMRLELGLGREW